MKWDELRGDERERFCAKCNRAVVNLSLMTEAERLALLASAQPGRLCVAYHQRLAGRTGTPAPRARSAHPRMALAWAAAAAAFVASLAAVAHNPKQVESAVSNTHQTVADTYHSIRYQMEDWIDNVRIFFGGTPRHTMILGVICVPSTPAAPPPTPAPASPPPQGDMPPSDGPG